MSSGNPSTDRADRSSLAVLAPSRLQTPAGVPQVASAEISFPSTHEPSDQEIDRDWRSILGSLLGSWLASFAAHILLLLLLTLITFGSAGGKLGLELSFNELEAAAEAITVDLDLAVDESLLNASESEMLESAESPLEANDLELSALLQPDDSVAHIDPFSATNLMKDSGLPESAAGDASVHLSAGFGGDGSSDVYGTRFFGLSSKGRRFVFVIDCSGSMTQDFRWEKAVNELKRAVSELDRNSRFLVLLYNSQTFIMMDTPPNRLSLVRATKRNVEKLSKWLNQQSPAGLTMPAHAMAVGLTNNPDAIFLLSDGLISDNTREMLRAVNIGRPVRSGGTMKIPVHTVAMDAGVEGSTMLQWIAEENEGQYRSVR